jgi:hypothetical protein
MPSIKTSSDPVTNFPYKFVSPFSDDNIIPLYSSINFINAKENSCLPCVVCGNNVQRFDAIQEQASRYKNYVPNQFNRTPVRVGSAG